MAISIQKVPDGEDVWGKLRVRFVDVTLDTSYPAAGYLVNASDLGMKMVYSVDIAGQDTVSEQWIYDFNINVPIGTGTVTGVPATSFNIKAYTAINTPVTPASSLANVTLRLKIIGQ